MSWQSKVLGLCKKYGSSAKFAATTILGIVPGGAALTPLIEKVFDTAQKSAQDDWEQNLANQVQLTAENVSRLDQILELLGGDLQHLMAQMASLQQMPEMANRLLEIARENDDRAKAALGKLDLIVHRFDRLESQNREVLSGQQHATRMIEEILLLVRGSVAPMQTEVQVQAVATAVAKKKQSLASKDLYLDACAESGTLVLSNDDVELLARLNDFHRESIRSVYAPCCPRLSDQLACEIWKLRNLEVLDLSSCPSISDSFFSPPGGLSSSHVPLLREVYFRSCRRLTWPGISTLARYCRNIESLFLDGNRQIDLGIITVFRYLPALRTLSVVGCGRDLREPVLSMSRDRNSPECVIIGP